jgi:hypothetical protein
VVFSRGIRQMTVANAAVQLTTNFDFTLSSMSHISHLESSYYPFCRSLAGIVAALENMSITRLRKKWGRNKESSSFSKLSSPDQSKMV